MRSGMLVYVAGLVLVTAAVELVIAFVLSTHGSLPTVSSWFEAVYLAVAAGLVAVGAGLIVRGWRALHDPSSAAAEPTPGTPGRLERVR